MRFLIIHAAADKPEAIAKTVAKASEYICARVPDSTVVSLYTDWLHRFPYYGRDWDRWIEHLILTPDTSRRYDAVFLSTETVSMTIWMIVRLALSSKVPVLAFNADFSALKDVIAVALRDDDAATPLDYATLTFKDLAT